MRSLIEKIRPFVLLEGGERLLCAAYVRSTAGPTVGPSIVAVSDRRLLIAPRSAFLSASAWTRRRLDEMRIVAGPRTWLGVVIGRRFEMVDDAGTPVVFEVEHRKDSDALREALARGVAPSRPEVA